MAIDILLLVLLFLTLPTGVGRAQFSSDFSGNYERVYAVPVRFRNIQFTHKLYVSIPFSLYEYYRSQRYSALSLNNPANFVTPEVVKPVAESLRSIFQDDEQFANAVLTLVHQMGYIKSGYKYPVESLVENEGDCSALAVLAASIMKAGGLEVVLIYYGGISPAHMNVGVYLPHTPVHHTWWMTPKYYEYKGRKYWVAEGVSSWFDSRLGDQVISLENVKTKIIPIENRGETQPALVSASLDTPLKASFITLQPQVLSVSDYGYTLNISGSIYPPFSDESVVIYISQDGMLKNFVKACTDERGSYSLMCNLTPASVYYLKASWSGKLDYAGSDSETFTVLVGPKSLVQFECSGVNCTYGRASLADYELRMGIGLKEFFSTRLYGINTTNFRFSAEFLVLKSNKSVTTFEVEEFLAGLEGLQLLRLPDDFNYKVNDKFGFFLRYNGDGGYLNIKGMNDYDVSEAVEAERVVHWNASVNVHENAWYKFTVEMSEGQVIAELRDMNNTVLDSVTVRKDAEGLEELVVFIANIRDAIVTLKNLQFETGMCFEGINGGNFENEFAWTIYIGFALLAVIAVVGYLLTEKKFTGNRSIRIKKGNLKVLCLSHLSY
jgi:hypothetical protein